jgi:hypothetical protein
MVNALFGTLKKEIINKNKNKVTAKIKMATVG